MKKIFLVAIILIAGWQLAQRGDFVQPRGNRAAENPATQTNVERTAGDDAIARAFANQQSNVQIESRGTVQKILPDDDKGSRHQRFIVRLDSGETVLIAHNIDLAPRVEALRVGDAIEFYGEYEWNNKGGVIHWTHRDPQQRHAAGWIRHNGRSYQ